MMDDKLAKPQVSPALTPFLQSPSNRFFIWAGLFYLLYVIYARSLPFPFIFDDLASIENNPDLRLRDGWKRIFDSHATSLQFDRRPVAGLISWLNYQIFGLNPAGFRGVNLLVHWLTAMTLGETLLLAMRRSGIHRAHGFAIGCALLWAIHPLNSMPVVYIYQRMEILMTLFYSLAIYCLLRSHGCVDNATEGAALREKVRTGAWMTLCLVSSILSILSKEVAVTLLAALPLFDYWGAGNKWTFVRQHRRMYGALFIIFAGVMVWQAGGPRSEELSAGPLSTPWAYFKVQCGSVLNYLRLVVWPHPLIFQHAPIPAAGWWQWLPQGSILVLCLLFVWHLGRHFRWVVLPGVLFFIVLSPTSSVIPIPADPQLEHRMYLASFFVIILGLGLASALSRMLKLEHWIRIGAFVVVTTVFAAATIRRVQDYRTPATLWNDVVTKQPWNGKAWINLGIALLETDPDSALECAQRVGTLAEGNPIALGWARMLEGMVAFHGGERYEEALALFEEAASFTEIPGANTYLGHTLIRLNRINEGMALLEQELATQPIMSYPAQAAVAESLFLQGRKDEAEALIKQLQNDAPSLGIIIDVAKRIDGEAPTGERAPN